MKFIVKQSEVGVKDGKRQTTTLAECEGGKLELVVQGESQTFKRGTTLELGLARPEPEVKERASGRSGEPPAKT